MTNIENKCSNERNFEDCSHQVKKWQIRNKYWDLKNDKGDKYHWGKGQKDRNGKRRHDY